jgi:type I restriction enzyme R subunit
MSEYTFVEQPFLNQLATMGWQIKQHGPSIPQNPAISLREDFSERVIKSEFIKAVAAINLHNGEPWLTNSQLEVLYQDFCDFGEKSLLDNNKEFIERLYKWQVDENKITGEQNPVVQIIDFDNWQANGFVAINQFRVDTPGGSKKYIIPDIVLFVNGLPLVVVECKDFGPSVSEPMYAAIEQLCRYADLREPESTPQREGDSRLFWTNQLMVASHGTDCKFGTISAFDEFYFNWKTIYSDTDPYQDKNLQHRSQETLVQGMLHPAKLLDITRSFTLFMEAGKKRIKVICRYQQYRAVQKMLRRLHTGQTGMERSGVIWHTQGSGKSLTMVFLVRKIRRDPLLKDYKILMINDRKDLDKQLGETAALTGEKVYRIKSIDAVQTELKDDSSTLNMVMIHKFREEDDSKVPEYINDVLNVKSNLADSAGAYHINKTPAGPKIFEKFAKVNISDRILILIDEAHRTQRAGKAGSSLSDNMFDAFPNATRLAFSGTPLIAKHHKDPTWKRFCNNPADPYIDEYRLQTAVDDGATLQILYEGRTADTAFDDKHGFDTKFENLFKERTDEEMLAIRRRYGATGDILEAEERIEAIALDIVEHYSQTILPGGFKAQVVCHSRQAALHYRKYIRLAVARWIALEQVKPTKEQDEPLLKQMRFIDTQVVISSSDSVETIASIAARQEAKDKDAIENFKKAFDYDNPETNIAILVVCDMLLTGFDAPIEQAMYLDKRLKEHNLLQAIARVNRTYGGKTVGYIVDYIGLTDHLQETLSLYASDDQKDIMASFKPVDSEMPVLENRYRAINGLFEESGIEQIEALVQQKLNTDDERQRLTEEAVMLLEDIKTRDSFNVYFKKFCQSMDIIMPNKLAEPFKTPMYQYAHIQAIARERYKDDSINIAGAGAKVRKLVNEHLISLGINPKIPPVELFSDKFIQALKAQKDPRAAASEMEHATRKHLRVHAGEDPVMYQRFSESSKSWYESIMTSGN